MTSGLSVVVALLLSVGLMVPDAAQAPSGAAFKQENTPDNLKALLGHVFQKFHVEKNRPDAIALFQSLLPDERRLRLALKDDLELGILQHLVSQLKQGATVPDDFTLGRPGQTEVQVHGATTEEIKAYREGSLAYSEFPGGARQMAERVLRPGMTFYEAEFLEPGKTSGIKYHLFYWDGRQWTMLGGLWRVIPAGASQAPSGAAFKQVNTADNLQALLLHVFRKFHVDKNRQDGNALFQSLIPDERRLRVALRDDLEPGALDKILEQHKRFGTQMGDFTLAEPNQTDVLVHGATTDQIKADRPGTIAHAEFPGGAKQMVERVLRPGTTFYEVEFVEPGKTMGIKYHLFYWDGQQWTMLGPIWRVFM